jgi:hypothetical protein
MAVSFGISIVKKPSVLLNTNTREGEANMRGEKVIVRAFGGEPLVRIVWAVDSGVVYICHDEGYQKLTAGEAWIPVGFPHEDVFRYDEETLARLLDQWRDNPSIWADLRVWQAQEASIAH